MNEIMNKITTNDLINSSVILSLRNLSENTRLSYLRTARQFLIFSGKDLKLTDETDVLNFIENLDTQGYKNATINQKRYSLQTIFNAMLIDGTIKLNPVTELSRKIASNGKKLNRPIDYNKKEKLELPAIHEATKQNDKTGLIISFLKGCGCRVSEMINIQLKDIKENGNLFSITIKGKGSKYRVIEIDKTLIEQIKTVFNGKTYLFETRTGKKYHRCSIYRMISIRFAKQSIKAGCHLLRHFYATYMIEAGFSLKAIADYLGHSFITLLKYYDHSKIPIRARFIY